MTNTFKNWLKQQFDNETLKDLAEHGAACGFNGLIYYTDTAALYNSYGKDLWDVLNAYADETGDTTAELLVQILEKSTELDDYTFKNTLVWFAAEHYAREIVDEIEQEEREAAEEEDLEDNFNF